MPFPRFKALFLGTTIALGFGMKAGAQNITGIWANDGGDKVAQDELRSTLDKTHVLNRVWDGNKISIFGSRNEVVAFNAIIEAGSHSANSVTVSLNFLAGSGGTTMASSPAAGNDVFRWTQRPIELFYVRYLQIKGLSVLFYQTFDERHIPTRLRRPWSGDGMGSGTWQDRPDHDKFYPEIAVPLELVRTFSIDAGHNQSIWVDIYIPKTAHPGLYQGSLIIQEKGSVVKSIPVVLTVLNLTLPDIPTAKTMLYYSSPDINRRYLGSETVDTNTAMGAKSRLIRDRHFMLAHHHKISLIGDSPDNCNSTADQPCAEWNSRLDGSLFTAGNGYDGPGVNVGNNVYSIGTYGSWGWKSGTAADMQQHSDAWTNWFDRNSPSTEYFLFLEDESPDTNQTEMWSQWILNNPGTGQRLKSLATLPLPTAAKSAPSLDIPMSTLGAGLPGEWQGLTDRYSNDARKRFYMYNAHRPATGSFALEDDGVALRELAWVQYKKHVNRWLYWESTYYHNAQGDAKPVNVFQTARTFGNTELVDAINGETGWNYSNGDGVLFYPGTDTVFPSDSYGVDGPFASLRLKQWRRGLQDADYLALAAAVDPGKVQDIVNQMVPKALWEYGVSDTNDPTWVRTDISWSTDPDKWETARAQLASIAGAAVNSSPPAEPLQTGGTAGDPSPNPWRKDKHAGFPVTFNKLPVLSTVKIFTVAGNLVKKLDAPSGNKVPWDLTNDSGETIASGIYLYLIATPDGVNKRGKIGVIR